MFQAVYDYCLFLDLLHCEAVKRHVEVHGYVLMTNHVHLIVTASSPSSVPDMMQGIGRVYVPTFNQRYRRTGGLWEGRYRASLIQDEKYWLTCLRYVELNPVRAGLVQRPDAYEWSSYRSHGLGRPDPLLTHHFLFLAGGRTAADRQRAWRVACDNPLEQEDLTTIRCAIQSGRPVTDGRLEVRLDESTVLKTSAG
jgi:putative transposase